MALGQDSKSRTSDGSPKGEHADFWEFWEQNQVSVFKICRYHLRGDEERAREVVSETMIKAIDAWESAKKHVKERDKWLLRIATNLCKDLYRKEKRHPQEGINDRGDFRGRQDGPSFSESPEESMLRREMYQQVQGAIKLLPEPIRTPSVLRWFQDMPYQEIAKQLNLSHANVRKRVQKGRGMVQAHLESYFEQGRGRSGVLPVDDMQELKAVKQILENLPGELSFSEGYLHLVQVTLPGSGKRPVLLSLDKAPARLQQKLGTLRDYVNRYPGGWKKRWELAEVLYQMGDWASGIVQLREVIARQPHNFRARIMANRILFLAGNSQDAEELCREALPFVRSDAARLYFHGWIELHQANFRVAADFFQKASEQDTGVAEYLRQQAICLLLAEEVEELKARCFAATQQALKDPLIDLLLFCMYRGEAIGSTLGREYRERYPRQVMTHWIEGVIRIGDKSYPGKVFKTLQKREPSGLLIQHLQAFLDSGHSREWDLIRSLLLPIQGH